ncbi:Fic family protein [Ramlibacter rhizophilus]|uniref:Fic family protein n=1 Tax=Ramlibacter rhizophilus TaxID=1781167 RepID=A0A4Z0BW33_9BURK|nr:Fic family protein [Ramlibacter rhizophilus]TFZ03443.1 Fic family protein [Ramlibacter rhizophilus]
MQSPHYVWQQPSWPAFRFDTARVSQELALARRVQGLVEGKLAVLGFQERQALAAEAWAQDAVATAAIEGERLDLLTVRSSVARRLGTGEHKGPIVPRSVDGLLDIMDDAVVRAKDPLTAQRACSWQAALFPTGFSGIRPVRTGAFRIDPIQVVSGPAGREKVHYEAPPPQQVPGDMDKFLAWFNAEDGQDSIVKSALAHLWFETIHPFDDGNGRVGRNIVDQCLARDAGETVRLVRISQRLLAEREAYYEQLAAAQHGDLDITEWMVWFVAQVRLAWEAASEVVEVSLVKARFWASHAALQLNARQRKAVNAVLDLGPGGFEGGLNTRKYAGLTGASKPTASRDLIELDQLGVLKQVGAGRSTRYYVNLPGWVPEDA